MKGQSSENPQPAELNKQSLRVETRKKIVDNKCGVGRYSTFRNRVPGFIGSDKAANLLAQTDEFKNAKNIKVNDGQALQAVRLQVLSANKTLYINGIRKSRALFLRVDVPDDAPDDQKKKILEIQGLQQHHTEISLDNKVKLDMIVIGSVVVSRDGYRIGPGRGFTDLAIGLLIEVGVITPETTIVTVVHDVQVVNTLPTKLFQKYDVPVDLIITPTEVIHVAKRLPRPAGVYWELLSEDHLKIVLVLQQLKENLEKPCKENTAPQEAKIIDVNEENKGEAQAYGVDKETGNDATNSRIALENLSLNITTGDSDAKPTAGKNGVAADGEGKEGDENTTEDTAPQEAKIIDINEENEGEAQANGVDKETGNDATNSRIALENLSLNIATGDGDANPTAGKNGVAADGEGKEGDENTTEDTAAQEIKIIDVNEENEGEAQANGVDKETGNDAINSPIALENLSLNITTSDGDAKPTAGKNGVAADGEGKEGDENTTEDTAPQEAKIIDVNEENEGEAQTNGDTTTVLGENVRSK